MWWSEHIVVINNNILLYGVNDAKSSNAQKCKKKKKNQSKKYNYMFPVLVLARGYTSLRQTYALGVPVDSQLNGSAQIRHKSVFLQKSFLNVIR